MQPSQKTTSLKIRLSNSERALFEALARDTAQPMSRAVIASARIVAAQRGISLVEPQEEMSRKAA